MKSVQIGPWGSGLAVFVTQSLLLMLLPLTLAFHLHPNSFLHHPHEVERAEATGKL